MNFLKGIILLIVATGVGIYLLSQAPRIFQGAPQERISLNQKISPPPAPSETVAPTKSNSSLSQEIPDYLIPSGFTREQLSPYFQKVQISSVRLFSYSGQPSQIQLYSSLSKDKKVNLTGWQIKTNNARLTIPQAVNLYEPSGGAPSEDIILSGDSRVNIYSNTSPLSKNLRLNKCIGYLSNNYIFIPSLPQNCPTISPSEISYLSGHCQSYILSLWGCKTPDDSFYDSLSTIKEGLACRQFLDTVNYNGCFQKHRFDSDFLSNEWWLWLGWGVQPVLDSQHDRLLLFDKDGLLVDEYTY